MPDVAEAVKGFQLKHGLLPTGEVTEATWMALEATVRAGLRPTWADGPEALREALRRLGGASLEDGVELRLRQFQSHMGLPLTGLLDEATILAIGE